MKFSSACSNALPRSAFSSDSTTDFRQGLLKIGPVLLLLAATAAQATPPTLDPIGDQPVREGLALTIGLGASDDDPGDQVTFSETGLPGFCTLTNGPGTNTGEIDCPFGSTVAGTYSVTVTATDDSGLPEIPPSETFDIIVSANAPPVLTPIADQLMDEGESRNIPLSATDTDTMSFSTTNLPVFCSLNNGNGTGSIDCDPLATHGGVYVVTVTVTDNGPIPETDEDDFQLTVTSNAAPNLVPIANQAMVEGGSLNIALSANDPDGNTMSFSGTTGLPGFCVLTDGNGTGSIVCNPLVGNAGVYLINVVVTDNGTIPASASDPFTLNVGNNLPPTASGVTITGNPSLGSLLTGSFVYSDAENDAQGTHTYQWLRDGAPISGAIGTSYTVTVDDIETALRFVVTPVAATGASPGTPGQSGDFVISNSAPSITGQIPIDILEDSSRAISLSDLTVTDTDSNNCLTTSDCTLIVQAGANYTRSGPGFNTITPVLNYDQPLSVPVVVNDGFVNSPVFNLVVTITPVNDAPVIIGPALLSTPEDIPLPITVDDLVLAITDPDNLPTDLTLVLQDGLNYTRGGENGNTITPILDFNGQLSVPATVSDLEPLASPVFQILIDVTAENDQPTVALPIGEQTAIEDSPFVLDVAGNFVDVDDGDLLTFSADGLPPSLSIDAAGTITGTPGFADARDNDPYPVTVTAQDLAGLFTTDEFDLTVSALGRANLGLAISVTPETALPSDQLRWTFASDNPVGPVAGENVELTGSFVGNGLAVAAGGGANCTISVQGGGSQADFVCTLGTLAVGGTNQVVFTTTTSQATEVVAFGTTEGAQRVPIDPNLQDNSDVRAVGVAESFSAGAVQILGNSTVRSVAAGDVNGDGFADLVVGTSAGGPVQIFLSAAPRESCQCVRDFVASPILISGTGSNEGVALADFDNNGTLDLVVANGGGDPDFVYRNDGSGSFTLMTTLGLSDGQDVAVGDFDNNGNMDIAIAANSPNLVYFGNGSGNFSSPTLLGDEVSIGVAVGRFDANNRDDLVFANVGSNSRVYTNSGGTSFNPGVQLPIGDAVSVAAADLNIDGVDDLVFGRVPTDVGDIPSNPVLLNQGGGTFGNPTISLGISPTNDVHIGDVNEDGSLDIVFVNASGAHQIWTATGIGYELHSEQIIDTGAVAGVLTDLGFADSGDPGGVDLAIGGDLSAGVGVYLNDSVGNLGRGDAVLPVITLNGAASVETPTGSAYTDAGATALDNIDGNLVPSSTSNVNTSVVGNYSVTYNVTDFAGNAATPVVRTVTVTPATGRGGGGGGVLGYWTLAVLIGINLLILLRARRQLRQRRVRAREEQ